MSFLSTRLYISIAYRSVNRLYHYDLIVAI
nr:MAG TPA: hypothetical protein [Caudoviricetes sp.]